MGVCLITESFFFDYLGPRTTLTHLIFLPFSLNYVELLIDYSLKSPKCVGGGEQEEGTELRILAILEYLDVFLKFCHSYRFKHNLSIQKYDDISLKHGNNPL